VCLQQKHCLPFRSCGSEWEFTSESPQQFADAHLAALVLWMWRRPPFTLALHPSATILGKDVELVRQSRIEPSPRIRWRRTVREGIPSSMTTSLEQLEKRLGVEWAHLRKARDLAQSKRLELRHGLAHLDSEDTSIVVSGSLARDEFTEGSDIDWTLLIDGQSDPGHYALTKKIGDVVSIDGSEGCRTRRHVRDDGVQPRPRTSDWG
jgi:hypothetical protein